MINIHFSLFPRWRGAAPVERAILAGDDAPGSASCAWRPASTPAPSWPSRPPAWRRSDEHAAALVARLSDGGGGPGRRRPGRRGGGLGQGTDQVGEPTYAAKLDPAKFAIDWAARPSSPPPGPPRPGLDDVPGRTPPHPRGPAGPGPYRPAPAAPATWPRRHGGGAGHPRRRGRRPRGAVRVGPADPGRGPTGRETTHGRRRLAPGRAGRSRRDPRGYRPLTGGDDLLGSALMLKMAPSVLSADFGGSGRGGG